MAAPAQTSPSSMQLASLATVTGRPNSRSSVPLMSTPIQPGKLPQVPATNDSKARFGCSSYLIALGITRLVKKALRTECWRDNAHPDVLVIVPPSITPEYDKVKFREEMGPGCHERCAGIAAQLEPMLKGLPGVRFLDANLLPGAGCSPVDGMHLTPEAHKAVAEALKNALTGVTL